ARGLLGVSDSVVADASAVVSELKGMGIGVVMVTGDNAASAASIARSAGIDHVVADVLPADKVAEVRRLQEAGHSVAMVGDGINDAPALAQADLGVAVGTGTHVAMESADIVLVSSELAGVPSALALLAAAAQFLSPRPVAPLLLCSAAWKRPIGRRVRRSRPSGPQRDPPDLYRCNRTGDVGAEGHRHGHEAGRGPERTQRSPVRSRALRRGRGPAGRSLAVSHRVVDSRLPGSHHRLRPPDRAMTLRHPA